MDEIPVVDGADFLESSSEEDEIDETTSFDDTILTADADTATDDIDTTTSDDNTSIASVLFPRKKPISDLIEPLPEYPPGDMDKFMTAVCRLFRGLQMVSEGSVSVLTYWHRKRVIQNTHASYEYAYIKLLVEMYTCYSTILHKEYIVGWSSIHHKAISDANRFSYSLTTMGRFHQVGDATCEIIRRFSDARRSILDAVYADACGNGVINTREKIGDTFTILDEYANKLYIASRRGVLPVFFMLHIDQEEKWESHQAKRHLLEFIYRSDRTWLMKRVNLRKDENEVRRILDSAPRCEKKNLIVQFSL